MVNKQLRIEGIEIGRDRLYDLLRKHSLLIKRKKTRVKTTNSKHGFRMYKNLIQDKEVSKANEVYVSDITYIKTRADGYVYLSLITDLWSRKIVGYYLSKNLRVEGTIKALERAMSKSNPGIIHHSGRGIQYCCNAYVEKLKRYGAHISMTEKDHVYENALAARVNGILKEEFMLGEELPSYECAKRMVKEAVEIYNNERLHMSLGYATPAQKHEKMCQLY